MSCIRNINLIKLSILVVVCFIIMAEISTKLTFARDIMAAINCNFAALISGVNALSIKYEKNRLEVIEINEKIKNILFQQETDCKKDEHSSTLQLDQNIININNQKEASSSNETLFTLETTPCEHITFNDYCFKKNNKFEIVNNINNFNIKSDISNNTGTTAYNLVLSPNNNYSQTPTKNKTITDYKIDDDIGLKPPKTTKTVLKNQPLKKQSDNNNTDIKSVESTQEKNKNKIGKKINNINQSKKIKKEKDAKRNDKQSTYKNSRGKYRKAKNKIKNNNRKKKIQNIKKKKPDQKQPPDLLGKVATELLNEYNDNYDNKKRIKKPPDRKKKEKDLVSEEKKPFFSYYLLHLSGSGLPSNYIVPDYNPNCEEWNKLEKSYYMKSEKEFLSSLKTKDNN